MGLFGYNVRTYAKNSSRFKKEIGAIMAGLSLPLSAVMKPLNNALIALSEDCTYKGDMDRKEATDRRIEGYLEKLKGAIAKGDKALALAYAELIGDAAIKRPVGDSAEDAPMMAVKEKSVIAMQRLHVKLAELEAHGKKLSAKGIDVNDDPTFLRLQADAKEYSNEHKGLVKLLSEMETQRSLRDTKEMADSTVLVDFLNEIKRDE